MRPIHLILLAAGIMLFCMGMSFGVGLGTGLLIRLAVGYL